MHRCPSTEVLKTLSSMRTMDSARLLLNKIRLQLPPSASPVLEASIINIQNVVDLLNQDVPDPATGRVYPGTVVASAVVFFRWMFCRQERRFSVGFHFSGQNCNSGIKAYLSR